MKKIWQNIILILNNAKININFLKSIMKEKDLLQMKKINLNMMENIAISREYREGDIIQ